MHASKVKREKTGGVIEVHLFDQYVIHVNGSGRVTLCNQKVLRIIKYTSVQPKVRLTLTVDDDLKHLLLDSNNPQLFSRPVHPARSIQAPLLVLITTLYNTIFPQPHLRSLIQSLPLSCIYTQPVYTVVYIDLQFPRSDAPLSNACLLHP